MTRREFLGVLGALSLPGCGLRRARPAARGSAETVVNDVHSRLNATRVGAVVEPATVGELAEVIRTASRQGRGVSVAGGRHAMGGQQFGAGTVHVDTRALARVLSFDREHGLIEVEAGIQWPELIAWYLDAQRDGASAWGIRQKQTGADRFTVAGSLSANGHGRGLTLAPLIGDVESLVLLDARGEPVRCSRTENPELFALAIGGYGLFGIMASVTLRLAPRQKLERVVDIRDATELAAAFARRIREGFLYGDFQFDVDPTSSGFLRRGVFACYRPMPPDTPVSESPRELSLEDWTRLLGLAHRDKGRAFDEYAAHYVATSGQVYWTDTHQLSLYPEGYHEALDRRLAAAVQGSEMISEVYVPRDELGRFLDDAAVALRAARANVVYGTIRLIERDAETFLPWAREPWACTVVNLHVDHDGDGLERARQQFRLLIDLARRRGGSYFLTYHRWATPEQVLACHPRFRDFLRLKRTYDPAERFRSDWYTHYRAMFA